MSVEFWIGQEFDTTHERHALKRFLDDMQARYGHSSDTYFILVNFSLLGKQIDLTVLKRDAVIVIDLKECAEPFQARENGPWLTLSTQREIKGSDKQNPLEQVNDYRKRWMSYLKEHQSKFLAQVNSMNFTHTSAVVAISPTLHPDTQDKLPNLIWFHLVGLDDLPQTIYEETSRELNFSGKELRKLVKMLNLRRGDSTHGGLWEPPPSEVGSLTMTTDPDTDEDQLVSFGLMALEQDWYDQAREYFEQALALDASNSEAMKGLARANEMLSRKAAGAAKPIEGAVRRVEPKHRIPEKKREGQEPALVEWFKKRSRGGQIAVLVGVPLLLILLSSSLVSIIRPTREASTTTRVQATLIPPSDTSRAGPPRGSEVLAVGVWQCPGSTDGAVYAGSKESDKFHYLSCSWAKEIKDENRICFGNRGAAVAYGYFPCGVCKP